MKNAVSIVLLMTAGFLGACDHDLGGALRGVMPGEGVAHAQVLQALPPKGGLADDGGRVLAGAPLSLTSSDGTGLRIVSLRARAVVEDPLAFTELHLVFQNPAPRQIEGQFEITLPEGATVSRFAMRQGDAWQEGEVVELQAARAAYEDFLHRRQDPALLEKQAGNQFRARVFPIPPSGQKEIILSYSQERVRVSDPYRIYLRGLPKLDSLDIQAIVGRGEVRGGGSSLGGVTLSHQTVAVHESGFLPGVDFTVPVSGDPAGQVGLRHENLVVGRITPVGDARPERMGSLLVLFDTSASRALGFKAQVERLGTLVEALRRQAGEKLPLRVVCFDQEIEEVFAGQAADFGPRQLGRISERRALGASDLSAALRAVAARKGGGQERVLLLTDGIATAGAIEGNDLRKLVQGLRGAGVRRLDALTFGGILDEALLARLVTAGLPADGVVTDGDQPAAAIVHKLLSTTISGIQVIVPGSKWVWPGELNGVQPGDQVLVYADLPADRPFSVQLRGQRTQDQTVTLSQVSRPLLERAWVGARIRRLMYQRDTMAESDQDLREALKHQIVDLSIRFRVLSDFTALLVLETEADYARFHIDRRALSDILTVGPTGIEIVDRKRQPLVIARRAIVDLPPPPRERSEGRMGKEEEKKESGVLVPDLQKRLPRGRAPAKVSAAPPVQADGGAGDAGRGSGSPRLDSINIEGRLQAPADVSGAPAPVMAPRPEPPAPATPTAEPMSSGYSSAPAAERSRIQQETRQAQERARVQQDAAPREHAARIVMRPPPQPTPAVVRDPRRQALQGAVEQPRMPEVVPYEGKLLQVMSALRNQRRDEALKLAQAWRDEDPGDVLALIGLGEALEAQGQKKRAARAYGSIIDLFPGRADLRRFAGERLERLGTEALALAVDTYDKARAQRPDHPASHRLLAFALLRAGKPEAAFDAIAAGQRREYPPGRFAGVPRILQEDVGLVAAAWLQQVKDPQKRAAILERVAAAGARVPERPSLRFVLNWETDANDVDFHIFDGQGGHAFYSQRQLPSGGELYADVTTGYGPECFTIEGGGHAFPYRLQAHYYSRGPMGYGMGKLEIIEHDGKGGLRFAERPFVIMADNAFVDLGQVTGSLR